jgi:zinc/manganese transport system substrate-binding protein
MEANAMRRVIGLLAPLVLALGVLAAGVEAADKIRVVTTTTDLKALAEVVGGDLVEVDSLARSGQNPHDLEVRPSLMIKVRRADLLVLNGLDLDGWAEVVVQGANNPNVIPGGPGRVDASQGVMVLEVPTSRVDRSMGDVHPLG